MAFGLPMKSMEPSVCGDKLGNLILEVAKNFVIYIGMVIACNGFHFLLKPYKQPRITSDIIVSFFSHTARCMFGLSIWNLRSEAKNQTCPYVI